MGLPSVFAAARTMASRRGHAAAKKRGARTALTHFRYHPSAAATICADYANMQVFAAHIYCALLYGYLILEYFTYILYLMTLLIFS